jgi:hypothetical protein
VPELPLNFVVDRTSLPTLIYGVVSTQVAKLDVLSSPESRPTPVRIVRPSTAQSVGYFAYAAAGVSYDLLALDASGHQIASGHSKLAAAAGEIHR